MCQKDFRKVWVCTVTILIFYLLSAGAVLSEEKELLLYAPFDGTSDAKVAQGDKSPRIEGVLDYVKGVKGEAVVVGGKDKCIYNAEGNFSSLEGTCSIWVKPIDWLPSVDRFNFFVTFVYPDVKESIRIILYKIHNEPSVKLYVENSAVSKANILGKQILSWQENEWHQMVFTWDKSKTRFYVDGEQVGEMAAIPLPEQGWKEIYLGIPFTWWEKLGEHKTALDEFYIYSRSFSASEVKDNFARMVNEGIALRSSFEKKKLKG